jgi:integrase
VAGGELVLTETVNSYVQLRRALGFAFEQSGARLEQFARFAAERGEEHVHVQTAIAWAGSSKSPLVRDRRLRVVTAFARHARAEDSRHEIPPDDVFPCPRRRPVPYIFRSEEIQQLLRGALCLPPAGSIRPVTYSTLIALLAATGLRIGEALRLCLEDLGPDGLVIRETKFRKSRLVPLHETARAGLERYLERRLALSATDDHILLDHRGERLRYRPVSQVFCKLTRRLGLRRAPGQPQPHPHALRHTFAVRALESAPQDGAGVERHILALSTYLGHTSVADTYWYLEATPQLLAGIAKACERFRQEASR